MAVGTGAGKALKMFQWFNRGVQLCCSVLILAIYSYFLASLSSSGLETPTSVRAVEGIAGVAALYAGLALLVLCCVTGHPFTSFVAMVFDLAFFSAFIYVANANRGGAGSCTGRVDTPFGSGEADSYAKDGLPNFQAACRLETACFALAMIAIFFFLFSLATELFLGRHRQRERRLALAGQNDFVSGEGSKYRPGESADPNPPVMSSANTGGFLGFLRRNTTRRSRLQPAHADPNYLPAHTHPDDVRENYTTETAVVSPEDDLAMHSYNHGSGPEYAAVSGGNHGYAETGRHQSYGEIGHGGAALPVARNSWEHDYRPEVLEHNYRHPEPLEPSPPTPATARFPAGNYRYDDGVYDARHT